MALNLSSLSTKEQATLHLDHPSTGAKLFDDAGNPVEIVLFGKASKQYRNAFQAMQNRSINRGKKKATAELWEQETVDLLAAQSVRCNNLVLADGREINSAATFVELYSDSRFGWIRDQVAAFVENDENFLGK